MEASIRMIASVSFTEHTHPGPGHGYIQVDGWQQRAGRSCAAAARSNSNAIVMSGPCDCIVAEDALSASVPLPKIMDAVAEILQIQI